jgi:hypothetical protein
MAIGFSRQHPEQCTDQVYSASLPRGTTVEVQFRRADVRFEMRDLATAASKPSRLAPHWGNARDEAFRWMRENGNPRHTAGAQSKLEKHISDFFASQRDEKVAESTIRKHVGQFITEFEATDD